MCLYAYVQCMTVTSCLFVHMHTPPQIYNTAGVCRLVSLGSKKLGALKRYLCIRCLLPALLRSSGKRIFRIFLNCGQKFTGGYFD